MVGQEANQKKELSPLCCGKEFQNGSNGKCSPGVIVRKSELLAMRPMFQVGGQKEPVKAGEQPNVLASYSCSNKLPQGECLNNTPLLSYSSRGQSLTQSRCQQDCSPPAPLEKLFPCLPDSHRLPAFLCSGPLRCQRQQSQHPDPCFLHGISFCDRTSRFPPSLISMITLSMLSSSRITSHLKILNPICKISCYVR